MQELFPVFSSGYLLVKLFHRNKLPTLRRTTRRRPGNLGIDENTPSSPFCSSMEPKMSYADPSKVSDNRRGRVTPAGGLIFESDGYFSSPGGPTLITRGVVLSSTSSFVPAAAAAAAVGLDDVATSMLCSSLTLSRAAASLMRRHSSSCFVHLTAVSLSPTTPLSSAFSLRASSSASFATLVSLTACFRMSRSLATSPRQDRCDSSSRAFSRRASASSASVDFMHAVNPASLPRHAANDSSASPRSRATSSDAARSRSSLRFPDMCSRSASSRAASASWCARASCCFVACSSALTSLSAITNSSIAFLLFSSAASATRSSPWTRCRSRSCRFLGVETGVRATSSRWAWTVSCSDAISSLASSSEILVSSSCFVCSASESSIRFSDSRDAASSASSFSIMARSLAEASAFQSVTSRTRCARSRSSRTIRSSPRSWATCCSMSRRLPCIVSSSLQDYLHGVSEQGILDTGGASAIGNAQKFEACR
ncbi:hypothetical protein U9M48_006395 [Paspalum notatum var. saurae]|uniref:Uncharacterized protein n=1 Tax=Paspalum notatum var. saurae TaxID=547442 RepID=A0AAQ3SM79_PASNO